MLNSICGKTKITRLWIRGDLCCILPFFRNLHKTGCSVRFDQLIATIFWELGKKFVTLRPHLRPILTGIRL